MGHGRGVWLCLALVPSSALDCGPRTEDEGRVQQSAVSAVADESAAA